MLGKLGQHGFFDQIRVQFDLPNKWFYVQRSEGQVLSDPSEFPSNDIHSTLAKPHLNSYEIKFPAPASSTVAAD
jgi:hypothetical protein